MASISSLKISGVDYDIIAKSAMAAPAVELSAGTDLKIVDNVISVNTDGSAVSANMAFVIGSGTSAEGIGSFAGGLSSRSISNGTLSIGYKTSAIGEYSQAFGYKTCAFNQSTHVEGENTSAKGIASHAEGWLTFADIGYSHAEGIGTTANNYGSHAEGSNTNAAGFHSHAEGNTTRAESSAAHAEGLYTSATDGGNTTYTGAAHAEGDHTSAVGRGAHAEGAYTIASSHGAQGHAEGWMTSAMGDHAHTEGDCSFASGSNAHAEGKNTRAFGFASHAEGEMTTVNGNYTHAEGTATSAYGIASHAEGRKTLASGDYSHAEGYETIAGSYDLIEGPHVQGEPTTDYSAYHTGCHAEGMNTTAYGDGSHAEGIYTYAGGIYQVEGDNHYTYNQAAHSEGLYTSAIGEASHAGGHNTLASGIYSFAHGIETSSIFYPKYGYQVGAPVSFGIKTVAVAEPYASVTYDAETISYNYTAHYDQISSVLSSWSAKASTLPSAISSWWGADGKARDSMFLNQSYDSNNSGEFGWQWGGQAAFGIFTTAIGRGSFVAGKGNATFTPYSFVAGKGNAACEYGQTVVGVWNAPIRSQARFVVGAGTSDTNRKNSFYVTNGGATVNGTLNVSDTSTFHNVLWSNKSIVINNNTDVTTSTTSYNIPLSIGDLNSQHLEIDRNEILSKNASNNGSILYLNNEPSGAGGGYGLSFKNGDFYRSSQNATATYDVLQTATNIFFGYTGASAAAQTFTIPWTAIWDYTNMLKTYNFYYCRSHYRGKSAPVKINLTNIPNKTKIYRADSYWQASATTSYSLNMGYFDTSYAISKPVTSISTAKNGTYITGVTGNTSTFSVINHMTAYCGRITLMPYSASTTDFGFFINYDYVQF